MNARECATQWLRAKDSAEVSGYFGSTRIECVCRAYLRLRKEVVGVKDDLSCLSDPMDGAELQARLRDALEVSDETKAK
jgi:hypothetical protein